MKKSCCIIGTGNLATHLIDPLQAIPWIDIKFVLSHNYSNAQTFGKKYGISPVESLQGIPKNMDLILLMVPDDVILPLAENLKEVTDNSTIIIHFSGSTGFYRIADYFENVGVLWPVQSFSKSDEQININEVPFCVTASNDETEDLLISICTAFKSKYNVVDEKQKAVLHLAAVMCNNFTNHLYHLSNKMLDNNGIDFEILHPIIHATANKLNTMSPAEAQTGPAWRNDKKTMISHYNLLNDYPKIKKIYEAISLSIINLNQE